MKKAAFFTLGCKVNQYETEAVSELFKKRGYEIVDFDDVADVYVINTCTVTNLGDRKSRQMIRKAKSHNRDSIVAVTGCYAQTAAEEVSGIPGVNVVIGTRDRNKIVDLVEKASRKGMNINAVENIMQTRAFEELNIEEYKERTRAFLKIQEGCSQFCSYCIIPYARGPIRSREPENVMQEVARLVQHGFKEIVLTGIHIASYGKDLKTTSLADIIIRIHGMDGIERIRLGSLEPLAIDEKFMEKVSPLKKLCPHYHISLQSGSDATLKRMNRKYTAGEYRNIVRLLRERIRDIAITTDVMTGFPGETDEEFAETLAFLKEIAFSQMHVFKYSPRKGTPAASFPGQVSSQVKEERSSILIRLAEAQHKAYLQSHIGKTMEVLFEQEAKEMPGYFEGFTGNYIKVLCAGNNDMKGNIRPVILEKAGKDFVTARQAES